MKSLNIRKIITIIAGIIVVLIYAWGLDNFGHYKLDVNQLETVADKAIKNSGVENYEITDTVPANQSISYRFEYDENKYGCVTFIKSIYRDKWRISDLCFSDNFENGKISYTPDTQILVYTINCDENGLTIEYDPNGANRLNTRVIAIVIISAAFVIGRMHTLKNKNKKF